MSSSDLTHREELLSYSSCDADNGNGGAVGCVSCPDHVAGGPARAGLHRAGSASGTLHLHGVHFGLDAQRVECLGLVKHRTCEKFWYGTLPPTDRVRSTDVPSDSDSEAC